VLAQCFLPRGWLQVALQSTFHGPLAYPLEGHVYPIFTRLRIPTTEEVEAGMGPRHERSFYRNSFSMVSGTVLRRCGATRVRTMTPLAVHRPYFISSTVLFSRYQAGNYDTALFALDCARSRRICTYPTHPGDVEACPKTGDLAGECCRRRVISRRRVERPCSRYINAFRHWSVRRERAGETSTA
jgi:hypothetical protein